MTRILRVSDIGFSIAEGLWPKAPLEGTEIVKRPRNIADLNYAGEMGTRAQGMAGLIRALALERFIRDNRGQTRSTVRGMP